MTTEEYKKYINSNTLTEEMLQWAALSAYRYAAEARASSKEDTAKKYRWYTEKICEQFNPSCILRYKVSESSKMILNPILSGAYVGAQSIDLSDYRSIGSEESDIPEYIPETVYKYEYYLRYDMDNGHFINVLIPERRVRRCNHLRTEDISVRTGDLISNPLPKKLIIKTVGIIKRRIFGDEMWQELGYKEQTYVNYKPSSQ